MRLSLLLSVFTLITLSVVPAFAASCCGGGGGSTLVAPKFSQGMFDVSWSYEKYDGYWNKGGSVQADPPGSDLRQYRIDLSYVRRVGDNWQAGLTVPMVANRNSYAGLDSNSDGLGDTSLSLWYEAFESVMCVWEVHDAADLKPATYFGATLTLPTGLSPYDAVENSFDVTGRGYYRLDFSALIEKTVYPWTVTLNLSYGIYPGRQVNREYGKYVAPYSKKPGDRRFVSLAVGYTHFFPAASQLTATTTYSYLEEGEGIAAGAADFASGMKKRSLGLSLAYTDPSGAWIFKGAYSHALRGDGQGANFPITDIYSIGVSYVLR